MIKFLIERPIAVLMAFTAFFIVGLVTYGTLPVSLLPDIAIPEITVQMSAPNTSARELENTVVKPVRQQLLQVSTLKDIHSETRDGAGIIRLSFDYGTNVDLAFIEANEKIDMGMNLLPAGTERPKVVKASATDIPVFYLYLTLKGGEGAKGQVDGGDGQAFLDLCGFAETVIKRRIEQLPEVAMVDVTGLVSQQVQVIPDKDKMALMGLGIADIEAALTANNVEPGSMTVRDGHYEYNIRFSTLLRTAADVEEIYLRKGDRVLQLKEFCQVRVAPERQEGLSLYDGRRAVTLAVIKQADENMDDMKRALTGTMDYFAKLYPDIDFHISRNQTELLDFTISNLRQNLALGFLFIFVVAIFFLGDVKSPMVIAISMVTAIVISFVCFYLGKVSLNIISLAGLILALGMMIDSSIIVTENISQYRERGFSLRRACVRGTSEVLTPMLSSAFTTIAVFLPLIFMSGIAGAIFYDQAFAVTAGLLVSYLTGIMLLPVLYFLVYRAGLRARRRRWFSLKFNNPIKDHTLDRFYDAGVDWVFAHKTACLLFCLASLPLCVFMFFTIGKERMPAIDRQELMVRVDWNENIHVDENRERVASLLHALEGRTLERSAAIGRQDYVLNREEELSPSEAELYFRVASPGEVEPLRQSIQRELEAKYPRAVVAFAPPENVFEKLFATDEPDVVAELYARNRAEAPRPADIRTMERTLSARTGLSPTGIAFDNQLDLSVDRERLMLYRVDYAELYRVLKTAFRENSVTTLHSYQQYLPISVAGDAKTVDEILQETLVRTRPDEKGNVSHLPLRELVRVGQAEDLKSVSAGRDGEYIPINFFDVKDADRLMDATREAVRASSQWEVAFSGSFFSNREMLDELLVVLLVSLALMYFILAAQFESFTQPLLVLAEIPVDVGFALVLLWTCGHTLNLMSAIGLVVTCGIVINDSILKLDAINVLRKGGTPLIEAIHEAGRRRLRPIIMTSLTTILAMVPLLFSSDMGSELQQPLSIAMIATMLIGTAVSLFIVPLLYWLIYRRSDANPHPSTPKTITA
ncbi:MAG: efflux RND transporter permease subunit [Mediterranea sp.]|jgi:multidrug efflux pump subunit AcrB|nr:efflux RND transporter permease subunit [Mediterranea sp.]